MDLSDQQRQAVDYIGSPTLVVAGAGAGKTRTLTAKIARLIDMGTAPESILAITFTNKAADEMKRRLLELTGLSPERFPWVRTYHSACLQILKYHCDRLGYSRPLQIYGTYQQGKLMTGFLIGMGYEKKHVGAVTARISNAKNSGHPLRYLDRHPRVHRIPVIEIYNQYESALKAKNAVDFDNILLLARDLLRDNPDVREEYQRRFSYILCDEYQDTNDLNEEITGLLMKEGNLFVVGDDWQSIYSFRMSNVNNFIGFEKKYKNAKIFRLEQNFRSADEIVQVANQLIEGNGRKIEKKCFSEKRGGAIEVHRFFDEKAEAAWVARKIRTLQGMGVRLEDMAILYRTKFCSLSFEKSLRAAGIPYQMLGGRGFFDRKEILDLNCYLTAAAFPADDTAFERALNTPKRGVGPKTVAQIAQLKSGNMGLQDAARKALKEKILTPKVYKAIEGLIRLLDGIRDLSPDEAIRQTIDRIDYHAHLKAYVKNDPKDYAERVENIDQLIYSAAAHDHLVDYLEEAALIREDKDDDEEDSRGVNLSTIHAAKGLEFYAVFVAACEEEIFPHWRSADTPAGMEEERRLMYVSITRSERYLYLSSAEYRRGNFSPQSRFIEEIRCALPN